MGRLGDREEDGAGEFYGEKDRKKRAGKRTGKDGLEMAARRNGSGETLNREKRSGKVIQKKHGGRKFCAQPKAGSTVVEGGTSG